MALPKEDQHILLDWIEQGRSFMRKYGSISGSIQSSPISGSLMGLIDLGYGLYLVQHNCGIPLLVKKRLLDPHQFWGALYEVWVAACFIQAGFKLEFEDESDSDFSHCEFTALHSATGRRFSVEAKRQAPNRRPEQVGRPLKRALRKRAEYARIIAIEANLEQVDHIDPESDTIQKILTSIRHREIVSPFSDRDAEPAYVIVTNSPYQHHPNAEARRWAIAEGYKIQDFKFGIGFSSVREMVNARDKHVELYDLMQSLNHRSTPPSTFNCEIPEIAFGTSHARLTVGNWYLVRGPQGRDISCQLEMACMGDKEAMCIMRTATGEQYMCSCPLTQDELAAYKRHPETFFGEIDKGGEARDSLDLYDFIYNGYRHNSKEHLIKLLRNHHSLSALAQLSQPELARIYAEWITECSIAKGTFDSER